MQHPAINVIVESILKTPTDNFTFLNVMTVITPFILLIVTYCINKNTAKNAKVDSVEAEKRANAYSYALRASDDKKLFIENAHRAIDYLFKRVSLLYQNILDSRIKKQRLDSLIEKITDSKNIEIKSTYEKYFDELLISNMKSTDEKYGALIIEIRIALTRINRIFDKETVSGFDKMIDEISNLSNNDVDIESSLHLVGVYYLEIDKLTSLIESNPEKWLKRSHKE